MPSASSITATNTMTIATNFPLLLPFPLPTLLRTLSPWISLFWPKLSLAPAYCAGSHCSPSTISLISLNSRLILLFLSSTSCNSATFSAMARCCTNSSPCISSPSIIDTPSFSFGPTPFALLNYPYNSVLLKRLPPCSIRLRKASEAAALLMNSSIIFLFFSIYLPAVFQSSLIFAFEDGSGKSLESL